MGAQLFIRLIEHLEIIYPGNNNDALASELLDVLAIDRDAGGPPAHCNLWSEKDSVLISYGDTIQPRHGTALSALRNFVDRHLSDVITTIHVLPFFPYSSDDGFSVIDYLAVNETLGSWDDISALSEHYCLMADLVINHVSSQSQWFENYRRGLSPGQGYFIESSPNADTSAVVRPRNSPLLTAVDTVFGVRHVWCTFSADQVDLNFNNPDVLIEFASILRKYLDSGIRWFRLDAVAFLWKRPGTSCIHLDETHELIKLLRTLVEHAANDAVLISETNVPNRENLTYFGNANEAHLIYNFSLPPLLLFTLLSGSCRHLKSWLMSMPPAQAGTAYLNFIASHDGIGLRPLDGLLGDDERRLLIETVRSFGGEVTLRKGRQGEDKPYELNIALYDALKGTLHDGADHWQAQRFVCAHTIMLALEGIPALYVHSLLASGNDYRRMQSTGRKRSINRSVYTEEQLEVLLASHGHQAEIFGTLRRLLLIRGRQSAFHPNATQFTLHLGDSIFAFWRQSQDRRQSIFCLHNISSQVQSVLLSDINLIHTDTWHDLITGERHSEYEGTLVLQPYQSVWLSNLSGYLESSNE